MKLDYIILEMDLKKKQYALGLSERETNEMIGISRATRWRISKGKTITVETLCKLIEFTEFNIERYFLRNK